MFRDMLRDGVVELAQGDVFLSRAFTVAKRDSVKRRLVVDLSRLNKFIKAHSFRMLTVRQVRLALKLGWWIASIDLQDAYWHVPIALRYRKFLAVQLGQTVL